MEIKKYLTREVVLECFLRDKQKVSRQRSRGMSQAGVTVGHHQGGGENAGRRAHKSRVAVAQLAGTRP